MTTSEVISRTPEQIRAQLARMERENDITILYAAESGSRAWGIASPDSDYDIRFIYIGKYIDNYLTGDVPESLDSISEDRVYDLAGWELRKTIKLLAKGNGNLLEWLSSPTVYIHLDYGQFKALDRIRQIGFDRTNVIQCYYGLFRSMCKYIKQDPRTPNDPRKCVVNLKQYFYIIRPLIFLTWYLHDASEEQTQEPQAHPSTRIPDVLEELQQRGLIHPEVVQAINNLIKAKQGIREKAPDVPTIPVIDCWIGQINEEAEQFRSTLKEQKCEQQDIMQRSDVVDQCKRLTVEMITHYSSWKEMIGEESPNHKSTTSVSIS